MTLKREEVRTQEEVRRFLGELAFDLDTWPQTPDAVRDRAAQLLRHLADAATVERGSVNG